MKGYTAMPAQFSRLLTAGIAVLTFQSSALAAEEGSSETGKFIDVKGMRATIVDGGSTAGSLLVSFSIEARKPEYAAGLTAKMPDLRAAATGALSEFATLYVSPWKPVNAKLLHESLTAALVAVDPRVRAVHLLAVRAVP